MDMNRIMSYGIPPEIIQIWKQSESKNLLPVQSMAVNQYGLFDSGNLLIQAPTSSGKTFVGEMAAIHTALRRKQVVYLVPLKALAEEKYADFKEKYEDYGLKVIISTRDHRRFDQDLEEGNFSIAVVVYEKLAQLLIRRPERISEIELVVVDELEILSDPERGPGVELLLTRLVMSSCRIVGLSAVIGHAEQLATWMKAKLLRYERRPVELRFGVLHDGIFRYRTYNDYEEGEEHFEQSEGDGTMWSMLSGAVDTFTRNDESCLIFVKAKHEARHGAARLSGAVNCADDTTSIERLNRCEPTCARKLLIDSLQSGVAFHSADLTPEERRIVEDGFRSRRIKVLVSTSTLAVGLNMPSCNVFISTEKWNYEKNFGMPWKAPILRAEYENMGGRAGRLGSGLDYGRSIILAPTEYDAETLWRRYVDGQREAIQPRLCTTALQDAMLSLVAASNCHTESALRTFLDQTPSGQWIWSELYTADEIEQEMSNALCRTIDAGMVLRDEQDDTLRATPMGIAVASKGISLATARDIEAWVVNSQYRDWEPIDALVALALTDDGRTYGVSLYAWEFEQEIYLEQIRDYTTDYAHLNDVALSRICNDVSHIYYEDIRGLKVALMVQAWIDGASILDIEERYNTMAGQLLMAVRQLTWLLDAAAAIAKAVGVTQDCRDRIDMLMFQVAHGVSEDAAPLAAVANAGISRDAMSTLVAQGLHTPQALVEVSAGVLEAWMTPSEAKQLKTEAFRLTSHTPICAEEKPTPKTGGTPMLNLDHTRPGEIRILGKRIKLQEKQFRLVALLAEHAGQCVDYETIYDELWGETIVEQNQIHFQKRKLKKAIARELPDSDELIRTVPKRGFMLELGPEEVEILGKSIDARQMTMATEDLSLVKSM